MTIFVINLVVVIIWATVVHLLFRTKITFQEALVQSGVATVVSIIMLFGIYYKDMGDTAVINGQVTAKSREQVSCSHSYQCRCYTSCSGTGQNRSCTRKCSTCYEHPYDVSWRVATTVGNHTISRVNRQGTQEPPRWTAVEIGEPAANTESYINYVKAAPNSLFAMDKIEGDAARFGQLIPGYPSIYDYYRINRVVQSGAVYPKAKELNDKLNLALRTLGAAKEVNIVVVFVNTTDTQYRYALERAWVGGKKNDVTVVIGMDASNKFSWVDTITFGKNSGNELLSVVMRDSIKGLVSANEFGDADKLADAIAKSIAENFVRKPMEDFGYLKQDYTPSSAAIMWFVIIQLLVLTGTTIFFYHFELERGDWSRKYTTLNKLHIPRYNIHRRSNRY